MRFEGVNRIFYRSEGVTNLVELVTPPKGNILQENEMYPPRNPKVSIFYPKKWEDYKWYQKVLVILTGGAYFKEDRDVN